MKARKHAELARLGAKMLRGVKLTEDDDDPDEPDVGELARQIMNDLTRGSVAAASNQTVDTIGNTSTGTFQIGVPQGLEADRSGMVPVKVEIGNSDIRFYVAGKQVSQCDRDLNRYPEAQRDVARAIDAARMEVVDKDGKYSQTPNYSGYEKLGGPYG